MGKTNGIYGKMAPGVAGTLYDPNIIDCSNTSAAEAITVTDLPSGGKMVSGSANQLRDYLMRDIEFTEEMRKQYEVDKIINEALEMQRRGRPAPIPRPTYLAVAIRAIYEDLESWSL